MQEFVGHAVDGTLGDHIDSAYTATQKIREILPGHFELLDSIHSEFQSLKKAVQTCPDKFLVNFLLRCHGSFLSAVGLGASGQLADAYAVSRAILEVAGYAFLASTDEELLDTWISGHDSGKARDRVRNAFAISEVKRALKRLEPRIEAAFSEQYDRTITFGGHPNVQSIANAGVIEEDTPGEAGSLRYYYIFAVPSKVVPALETSARCAIIALTIFCSIWETRLTEIGYDTHIRGEIGRWHAQLTELRTQVPPDFVSRTED